jgi:uncharacterized protein YfcZ (UPF0381/DUF406 family)
MTAEYATKEEENMTDMTAENGFSIDAQGVIVSLPHRDDGKWSLQEVIDQCDAQEKKKCPCGGICFIVPGGTLVEVDAGSDPRQIRLVSPTEVERRMAENRLWLDDHA